MLLLAAGGAFAWWLQASAPKAAAAAEESAPPRVTTEIAEAHGDRASLRAQGRVHPARAATLTPRVSGPLVWVSDALREGGRFDEDEPIARIDRSDYRVALARRQGERAEAELALARAESRGRVAQQEWREEDGAEASSAGAALARHEPQLEAARAALRAAKANVRHARRQLRRTTLRAPFSALVTERHADLGQRVGPSQPVATLAGTEAFEVHVPVPRSALERIALPAEGASSSGGASARIVRPGDASRAEWSGRVRDVLPSVEEGTSLARVAVRVPGPLAVPGEVPSGPGGERARRVRAPSSGVPLLLGAFVDVEIAAESLPGAVRIPKPALLGGDYVWLVREGRLERRDVEVLWMLPDSVLTRSVEPGAELVTGRLRAPTEGMRVRTR